MNRALVLNICLILACSASGGQVFAWQEVRDGAYWIEEGRSLPDTDGVRWSGIRVRRDNTSIQLVELKSYYAEGSSTYSDLKIDPVSGTAHSLRYSLRELWNAVRVDASVLAVIPIGYLELAGSPQTAGYLKIRGIEENPTFNAPNMSAIYCNNNVALSPELQSPYLFYVNFDSSMAFRYSKSSETVDLLETSEKYFLPTLFAECPEMVQVGPRLIEPRGLSADRSQGRISRDVLAERPPFAPRTIASWDLNAEISFLSTDGAAPLRSIASAIESTDFYTKTRWCRGGGRDPERLSKSCEYWSVTLTSFEHSGIIMRGLSGDDIVFGSVDSVIPCALIVRLTQASE